MSDVYDSGKKWHQNSKLGAFLDLSKLRKKLTKHNLHNLYKDFPTDGEPGPADQRNPGGQGNDRQVPRVGARNVNFGRNIDPEKLPEFGKDLLDPDPRVISEKLLRREKFMPVEGLNLLIASWLQFMVHDWFFHRNDQGKQIEVPLDPRDPFPEKEMKIPRTEPSPEQEIPGVTAYQNDHPHWWDATTIYGKDAERLALLRSGVDGKLKMESDRRLMKDEKNGTDLTGFNTNYWIGLSMCHTLMTMEHNWICDSLKAEYPEMKDEQLFQKARLINTMIITKIQTVEWTPAILNHPALDVAMKANWHGMRSELDLMIDDYFGVENQVMNKAVRTLVVGMGKGLKGLDNLMGDSSGTIRNLNYVLNGITGNPRDYFNSYHTLTEEFVAAYRMHSLMPDSIEFRKVADHSLIKEYPTEDTAQAKVRDLNGSLSLEDMFYSFGTAHPGRLRLRNFPGFLMNFVGDDGKRIDLSTIDILRDRERQIPRYNEFRRQIGMEPAISFAQLLGLDEPDSESYSLEDRRADGLLLNEVYEGDIEKVDLMIGCLAEYPWPDGYGFGETAFQVFLLMASRRLLCDRFYTDDFRPEIYTQWGYDYVKSATLKSILIKFCPELKSALEGVENVFFPWNQSKV